MEIAKFAFVILLIGLTSCNTKKVMTEEQYFTKSAYEVDLINSHDVDFKLNNETSLTTSFLKELEMDDGSLSLVYLNEQIPAIYFYDINTQQLIKEVLLQKEGPDAVGSPTGLFVQSMDSIYVISSSYYKVTLVNGNGEAQRSYRLIEGVKPNDNTGMLRPFTISPPVVINKKMYFNVAPDRDVYDKSYYQGKVNLVLDLETGEFRYFNNYPSEFEGGVWGVASVSFSSTYSEPKNQFVYSFAICDSLYVYDVVRRDMKGYLSQTSTKKKDQEPMKKPTNQHDLEYALQATYYDGIIYDKYRSVYYRVVRQPLELQANETPNFYDFHRKPISVIILNEELQKIGETQLENDIYQSSMYFLTKDGLFISKGNPNNPNLKEEEASFTCFKLRELEKNN